MPATVDKLYEQAMKLSEAAREKLAERLLRSVEEHHEITLHPSWNEELRRRLDDIDSGRVKWQSLSEAMRIIMDDSDESGEVKNRSARRKRRTRRSQTVRKKWCSGGSAVRNGISACPRSDP